LELQYHNSNKLFFSFLIKDLRMSILIPIPQNITQFILSILPKNLDQPTINLITNILNNLADEGTTPNEIFNFVIQALPGIKDFFVKISVASTLKNTFQGYTNIWLPFQYGILILVVVVSILIFILIGKLDFFEGFILMIAFISLLLIIGLIEYDSLASFTSNKETEFINLFNTTFNNLAGTTLLNGALGYVSGSQLTVNGPTGPNGVPQNGPIILNDSTSVFHLFPPSFKLTVFQTQSTGSGTQPEVFQVQLQELDQTVKQAGIDINFNTIKFQYGKIIYIINGNPSFSYALFGGSGTPGDPGVIKIINAVSLYPPVGNLSAGSHNDQVPLSSLDPPFQPPDSLPAYINPSQNNNGVLIYPGETKAFVNAGYNQLLPPSQTTSFPNMGFTTWIEVTADLRPFSSVFTSTSMNINLRPTNRIIFLTVSTNANIDLTSSISTTIAVKNQELYLIANPPSGTINIILNSDLVVLPKSNLCYLTFDGNQWIKGYP